MYTDGTLVRPGTLPELTFDPALADKINHRLPFSSLSEFRSGVVGSSKTFILNEPGKEGVFILDTSDNISQDDNGALVLVADNLRFKRDHNGVFTPSWWEVDETGVANSSAQMTKVFQAANAKSARVEANGVYLINDATAKYSVLVYTNLSGHGTFLTRNSAVLKVMKSNITISGITVDGGSNTGCGITNDGWSYLTIDGVKVRNVSGQGIWSRGGDYAKFINNTIRNCRGSFGDGIYSSRANNVQILNNQCYEFQRIGIAVEGSEDPVIDYSNNVIIMGNICKDAIYTLNETQYPNGGIWCENVADVTVIGNHTENTFFRGIAVTPSIEDGSRHKYIISENTIKNCMRTDAAGLGYGIAFVYATGQVVNITDNHIVDCQRGIGLGDMDIAFVKNNTFSLENRPVSDINCLISIDYIRTADASKRSKVYIDNCINNISGLPSGRGVTFPNVNNLRGDLEVSNCKGDFSFIMGTQQQFSSILVRNCKLDYTTLTGSNVIWFNVDGKVKLIDTEIIVGASFFPYNSELIFDNCEVKSGNAGKARITLFSSGSRIIRIKGSTFKDVYFYNIRRAGHEFYLRDSSFEGYDVQGVFDNTVVLVSLLDVDRCSFDKVSTNTPLRFSTGVSKVVMGGNIYNSGLLIESGSGVIPVYEQYRQVIRHSVASRPAAPRSYERFYNTELASEEFYNGVRYVSIPDLLTNNTTVTPTKESLNVLYGNNPRKFEVFFPNRPGGAKLYKKLSDGASSEWYDGISLLA